MAFRRSFGLKLRRARIARNLSQKELAAKAGISQAVVSYYETGRASPSRTTLSRLARVLAVRETELEGVDAASDGIFVADDAAAQRARPSREAFLRSLERVDANVAVLDRPAGPDGGDLAFALELRNVIVLVLIDAEGSGPIAAPYARLAAACAFGATSAPGGGVPVPEDVVETSIRFWRTFDVSPRTVALGVFCIDRRRRRVSQCRIGLPAPYLGPAQWQGKPEGPAGSFIGERTYEPGTMLLAATDGIAHLATKGDRTLWQAPELRATLARAAHPSDAIDMLERRVHASSLERADDRFAVAVQL